MRRGSEAVLIVPAAAVPKLVFGRPKLGVLVKLNDSKRNCIECPSHGRMNRRETEKSNAFVGGPRIMLRPALSSMPGWPACSALVSNQRSIVR